MPRRQGLRAQPDRHPGTRGLHLRSVPVARRPAKARSSSWTRRRGSRRRRSPIVYLALDAGLEIIPVLNKIDLPAGGAGAASPGDHRPDRGPGARRSCRSPRKTGTGIEAARGNRQAGAPPRGRRGSAASGADLRFLLRPYRGAVPSVRVVDGTIRTGIEIAFARRIRRRDVVARGRLSLSSVSGGRTCWRRARSVTSSPTCKERRRHACRRHASLDAERPRLGAPARLRDVKPMVFAGIYPTDSEQYEDLRDALEKLKLNDAESAVRARDLHRAGLRLPLRLSRPAPHGDRRRTPGAGVRPRPDRHRADGGVPRLMADGDDVAAANSGQNARSRARSSGSRSRTCGRGSSSPKPSTSAGS